MEYLIIYEIPTASGRTIEHFYIAETAEETEAVCKKCEVLGYRIKMMVNREN